jgi:hypothetical protein
MFQDGGNLRLMSRRSTGASQRISATGVGVMLTAPSNPQKSPLGSDQAEASIDDEMITECLLLRPIKLTQQP